MRKRFPSRRRRRKFTLIPPGENGAILPRMWDSSNFGGWLHRSHAMSKTCLPSRSRRTSLFPILASLLGTGWLAAADYPVQPVPFTDVSFTGGLWHDRQEINNKVTLPFALGQCESSKRMENFDLAADTMKRRAAGEKTLPTQAADPISVR